MLDRYVWDDAERISKNAPVIHFHSKRKKTELGQQRGNHIACSTLADAPFSVLFHLLRQESALPPIGSGAQNGTGQRPTFFQIWADVWSDTVAYFSFIDRRRLTPNC
jgi:hypothetical protein